MIFTSFEFVLFFIFALGVRSVIRNFSIEKNFLLVASYAFYMSWSVPCGFLLLATSLVDYAVGAGLERLKDERQRKWLLVISIVANLGVLAFFKYANFFLENAAAALNAFGIAAGPWHYNVILPAGISFFTFQSMTYTIETYRRSIPVCHSPRDFLLFTAFFPQLLAGPINRAKDLLPQFGQRVRANWFDIETGLAQFCLGAVKKLVISDQIASSVDLIFRDPGRYDGVTLLVGALGYAIQIYCDFSGYSDMAIGCARMMGFRFMENFQMPYSAVNITEFWRRWHISLSSWFRDYLYIPLGGNRKGPVRTYVNLLITMLLCGLWHGASWNFVFWGGMHGVALAIHRLWSQWRGEASESANAALAFLSNIGARVATLAIVLVGWIFFRAQSWDAAVMYLNRMVTMAPDGTRLVSPQILGALAVVVAAHLAIRKDRNWAHEIPQSPLPVRIGAYASVAVLLSVFAASEVAPFIYFQF